MQRLINAYENSSGNTTYFRGLDRRLKGSKGGFLDMKNMTSSGYPSLLSRNPRKYLEDDGIKNKRLVIPPLNKDLSDKIPKFTGIADDENGDSALYYNGERVGIDFDTFPMNEEYYALSITGSSEIKRKDCTKLFPKAKGTEISYCYLNNRLFLFVTNNIDFDSDEDLTFHLGEFKDENGEIIFTNTNYSQEIYLTTKVSQDVADRMIGRNIECYSNKINVYYNIEDVDNTGDFTKIILNKPFCANPYAQTEYPIDWTVKAVKDSIKCYYDAGKKRAELKNAERGVYNEEIRLSTNQNCEENGVSYVGCALLSFYQSSSIDFTDYFSVGDQVSLNGYINPYFNTVRYETDYERPDEKEIAVCNVVKVTPPTEGSASSKLWLQMFNCDGKQITFSSIEDEEYGDGWSDEGEYGNHSADTDYNYNKFRCVYKTIPTMSQVIAHNQRLWGVNPNGEYIYASAPSDPFTWHTIAENSQAASLCIKTDTMDEFKGIINYNNYLLLLKSTSIQQIYALASASSIQIAKALYNSGCIDIKSAVVIANTVYYLGYNGFYRYSGQEPENISTYLNTDYISATAFTDGIKYYASAIKKDGGVEFLVYDTQRGYWHKEDDTKIIGAYRWYDKTIVTEENNLHFLLSAAQADEATEWMIESVKMHENVFDDKVINEIWVRANIEAGQTFTVWTRTDDGEWTEHTTHQGTGRTKIYRTPIRAITAEEWQYKLTGGGRAVIYDIEWKFLQGGGNYNSERR